MNQEMMNAMLELDEHHWWYRGRRLIIRSELDRLRLAPGAVILDAGCGSGRTLQDLADYGEVHGIELDPDAAEVARQRGHGEVRVGRLENLPWPQATFDLITSLDVIEHTPDDRLALLELRRVAKPGAWLLVTVPAYQALWSPHDDLNHHFRRYNRPSLRAAGEAAGWTVARLTAFNSLLLAPAAAVRLAQRRIHGHNGNGNGERVTLDLKLSPDWLNGVLERPMRIEARWLARGRTLPAGLSLLAVMHNGDH